MPSVSAWELARPITGFVTRITRRVSLLEQEMLTLPEHLSPPPVFSGVRVTRSLVLYVCFVDRCLSFCTFSEKLAAYGTQDEGKQCKNATQYALDTTLRQQTQIT
jgi:hypothetical protein